MSTTLSNGFILPNTGDKGSTFFPDLESNIQQVNDHTHNGVNSNKLTAEALEVLTSTVNPGDWVLHTTGQYRAAVTMPGSLTFDTSNISLRTNNRVLYSDIEKITTNTLYVYVNDNTLTVTVVYS